MPRTLKARITKAAVDKLAVGDTIRDVELKGFGARRQADAASYFVQKRIRGRLRWITIGLHGAPWTPETARREAFKVLAAIVGGGDPTTTRKPAAGEPTLAEAIDMFLVEHGPRLKPTTQEKYEIYFRLHVVPDLGVRPVDSLKRTDILRLHTKLAARPTLANYCVAILSKLMAWCEENGLRTEQTNPCRKIKKFRETKRQRYLSRAEMQRLGAILDVHAASGGESIFVVAALRLLLLTGARLGEIITLKWTYVDLERGLLLLPDSKTGQKTIHLNLQAIDVLKALPRVRDNPYVIVGRVDGARLINLQKPWRRIRAEAGLDDVRIHDLRHSFASMAAASGASLPMIGKLLGHSQPATTARYAHLTDDPVRQVNALVGHAVAEAMGREKT